MKKLFLMLLLTTATVAVFAQSQLSTVRGKTKDGKKVKVEYYKGNVEDVIQSVSYDLVDDLQAKVNKLQTQLDDANKEIKKLKSGGGAGDDAEVRRLRKRASEYETEVKSLNKTIEELRSRISVDGGLAYEETMAHYHETIKNQEKNIEDLNTVVAACNQKIKELDHEIEVLKGAVLPPSSPVIGLEFGIGPALGSSTPEMWSQDVNWAKQVAVYFGTASLTESFPLSVEAGLGIRSFNLSANLATYSTTVTGPDNDNDNADMHYTFHALDENLGLTYLDIPVRVCFGVPLKDRVTVYGKLGLTPSIKVSSSFKANGTYDLNGYYPQWDVTLEDITELGYGEGLNCYEDDTPELKSFVLWGNVALGAYMPFKGSPLALNAGVKLDIPFGTFGTKASSDDFLPGTHAAVLGNGGKAIIPSFEIGLIYNLK